MHLVMITGVEWNGFASTGVLARFPKISSLTIDMCAPGFFTTDSYSFLWYACTVDLTKMP
jgi:hypothetical protein